MTRPNSLPLLPPLWGVQSCFFLCFFCFFCFLFSGSLLVFVQWLNKTKIQNPRNQKNKKKMTRPNSLPLLPPWGVQSCFFLFLLFFFLFCFFGFLVSWCFSFLVSWFLVFWFVVGFLKGWQNNTKVKDLDLTLCQFSHFRGCKLAFGWFYCLLWACGSIRKPCKKKHGKMQVSLEEAWGAWDTD